MKKPLADLHSDAFVVIAELRAELDALRVENERLRSACRNVVTSLPSKRGFWTVREQCRIAIGLVDSTDE